MYTACVAGNCVTAYLHGGSFGATDFMCKQQALPNTGKESAVSYTTKKSNLSICCYIRRVLANMSPRVFCLRLVGLAVGFTTV